MRQDDKTFEEQLRQDARAWLEQDKPRFLLYQDEDLSRATAWIRDHQCPQEVWDFIESGLHHKHLSDEYLRLIAARNGWFTHLSSIEQFSKLLSELPVKNSVSADELKAIEIIHRASRNVIEALTFYTSAVRLRTEDGPPYGDNGYQTLHQELTHTKLEVDKLYGSVITVNYVEHADLTVFLLPRYVLYPIVSALIFDIQEYNHAKNVNVEVGVSEQANVRLSISPLLFDTSIGFETYTREFVRRFVADLDGSFWLEETTEREAIAHVILPVQQEMKS